LGFFIDNCLKDKGSNLIPSSWIRSIHIRAGISSTPRFYKDRLTLNKEGAISAMAVGGGLALFGKIMGLNDFGLYGFFYQDLFSSLEAD